MVFSARRSGGMGKRTLRLCGPAIGAVLLLAACSSSHSGGSRGSAAPGSAGGSAGGSSGGVPTNIAQALAQVPSTDWDTAYIEFSRPKTILHLDGGKPGSGPLSDYGNFGEEYFESTTEDSAQVLGFDPLAADAALTVGAPGKQAAIVYGTFDASSVGSVLGKEGFKSQGTADGAAVWAIGDNNQMNENNPTGVPNLNVMLVSPSRIVLGGAAADAKTIASSSGTSISGTATLGALAGCLGPAPAALIGPESNLPKAPMLGIGVLADSGTDASEELCVAVPDASAGSALAAHVKSVIATGRSRGRGEPWSKVMIDPRTTVLPPVDGVTTVRLTVRPGPDGQLGALLSLYYGNPDDSLSKLIGE